MTRSLIALLCATSAAADYVVDWRVPQDNDANANAWVAAVVVPVGEQVVKKPKKLQNLTIPRLRSHPRGIALPRLP